MKLSNVGGFLAGAMATAGMEADFLKYVGVPARDTRDHTKRPARKTLMSRKTPKEFFDALQADANLRVQIAEKELVDLRAQSFAFWKARGFERIPAGQEPSVIVKARGKYARKVARAALHGL